MQCDSTKYLQEKIIDYVATNSGSPIASIRLYLYRLCRVDSLFADALIHQLISQSRLRLENHQLFVAYYHPKTHANCSHHSR